MRVRFKTFRSGARDSAAVFGDAAEFASTVGPDRLIGITQTEGQDSLFSGGAVTVWYWDADASRRPAAT